MKQEANAINGAINRSKVRLPNTTSDEMVREASPLDWNNWSDWEDIGMGDGEEVDSFFGSDSEKR